MYAPLVVLTLGICVFAQPVGRVLRLVDVPDGSRKRNSHATPLVGGLAILLHVFLVALILTTSMNDAAFYVTLAAAVSAFFVLGFIDDRKPISPVRRLAISLGLCVFVLWAFPEFEVRILHFGFLEHPIRLGIWAPVFTIVCLVGLQNVVNMADGKNGLVLGLSLVWAVLLLLYAPGHLQPLLLIIIAAVAVTLIFNLRGCLFLGDSGAYGLSVLFGLPAIYVYNERLTVPTADVVAL